MKFFIYLSSAILLSVFSFQTFAGKQDYRAAKEVKCVEGATVQALQDQINLVIAQLDPYKAGVSAPALVLKHPSLANPYVMCVTVTYTLD